MCKPAVAAEKRSPLASTDPSLPIMQPCQVILSSFLRHDQYPFTGRQSWAAWTVLIDCVAGDKLIIIINIYHIGQLADCLAAIA